VNTLTVAEQQQVEIVKVLLGRARILIFDEPTAVLTDEEAESLLAKCTALRRPARPIHCTGDTLINVECGRFLAERIPGARLLALPGIDHLFFIHEQSVTRSRNF
jgi:general nucleoside transport system ATP-binding protein